MNAAFKPSWRLESAKKCVSRNIKYLKLIETVFHPVTLSTTLLRPIEDVCTTSSQRHRIVAETEKTALTHPRNFQSLVLLY